jgi:hypothetical protein
MHKSVEDIAIAGEALTLTRLRRQASVTTTATAVLLCPPLGKKSLRHDMRWFRLGKRPKDFAKKVMRENGWESWAEYEKNVTLPVLSEIVQIRESTDATILPEVTFKQFRDIAAAGRHELLILVAHHIPGNLRENPRSGWIEFRDGGYTWREVENVLSAAPNRSSASFVFIVCKSGSWASSLAQSVERISGGSSDTYMPLVEAAQFIRIWLSEFDGATPVWLAFNRAVHKHLASWRARNE